LFVGFKMIASDWIDLPDLVALGVIAGILFITIVASLTASPRVGERSHG
jgi:hypothetical protein